MQDAEAKPMEETNSAIESKTIEHHFANKTMRVKALALPPVRNLWGDRVMGNEHTFSFPRRKKRYTLILERARISL
jgi:hypothetical protein